MIARFLLLALTASIFVAGGAPMSALQTGSACAGSGGFFTAPVPKPPKGKGDKCVADTDFMRRNHMDILNHQRDGTVHEGIRTKRFSLNECISCHAVNGPDAKPVTVKDPKHFCRVCHDYAGVSMDCFQCHASRPVDTAAPGKAAALPGHGVSSNGNASTAALAAYLRRAQQ